MKFLIFSFFLFVLSSSCQGQGNPDPCPYDNSIDRTTNVYGAIVGDNISHIGWSGEGHRLIGMEANKSYLITLCVNQGFFTTFDEQITIYTAGGGQAVAWNDDGNCSVNTVYPYLVFTPPNNGDYDILFDEYWSSYCMHFQQGFQEYFHYEMEVISVNPPASMQEDLKFNKKLVKTLNVFGQETTIKANTLLFYIYNDGSVEKRVYTN